MRPAATLRLGLPAAADLEFFGDAAMHAAHLAARDRVAHTVARTVPVDLAPFLEAGDLLYSGPWLAERLAPLADFLTEHPDAVLPVVREILQGGYRHDAVATFRAQHRLSVLKAAVGRLWGDVDVLLLPTVGTTFTVEEMLADPVRRNTVLGRYTMFGNLLDLAVVAIPAGTTADGRPVGIQLIGRAFSDATLAALAGELTGTAPAMPPPPEGTVTLAVVGHHLDGGPRNGELRASGARLLGPARTAPTYQLFELAGGVPGLVRSAAGGTSIEVELWRLPAAALGGLLAGVRGPLGLGWVQLEGGEQVIGFLSEAYATGDGALDITASGGWRTFLRGGPT